MYSSARLQRGFSLIEALISIVIVAAILLALLGIIPYGFNQVQVNATQAQAIALGQQYLDVVRNAEQSNQPLPAATSVPIDQGDQFMQGSANSATSTFTITPNTCPLYNAGATASQYDCSVTVTWVEDGQSKTVRVETYVTR